MSRHRHRARLERRLWVWFWVERWRFFCSTCDARGPWRKTQKEADADGFYHEDAELYAIWAKGTAA